MGEAKHKRLIQQMAQSLAAEDDEPRRPAWDDSSLDEADEGVGADPAPRVARKRLNLSLSPQLSSAVRAAADVLGVTDTQIVLQALIVGLPQLQMQVRALSDLLPSSKSN
ncbi:MAG: hypothetical protein KGJ38_17230 [Burkholderiaceae bacterium]|nr:hypothetical protein [Burkholderiaceae bacterium]